MKTLTKYYLFCLALVAGVLAFNAFADSANGTRVGANQVVKTNTFTVANAIATNVAALTTTSGLAVDRGGAVAVTVCAEVGQTVTSGNLRAYVYMPVFEPNLDGGTGVSFLWIAYPALDFAPTASVRCSSSGDKQSFTGIGRIVWLEDDIAVSGGTTVTSTIAVRAGMPL